jgi:hypothetical protein
MIISPSHEEIMNRPGWISIDAAKVCRNRDGHDLCDLPAAAQKALKPLIAQLLRGIVMNPDAIILIDGSRVEAMWEEPIWAIGSRLKSYRWVGWWYFSPGRESVAHGYFNVYHNDGRNDFLTPI